MIRIWSVSLLLAVGFPSGSAVAACQGGPGGLVCGGGSPSLSSPAGLQVSRGGNFRPLDPSRALRGGDRLLSGVTEVALSLGQSCTLAVGAGSLVTLSQSGGQTCARVTEAQGTTAQQDTTAQQETTANQSNASGSSHASGPSGASSASGASGASVASGVSGSALSGSALTGLGLAAAAAGAVGVGYAASSSKAQTTVSAQ